MKIKNLLRGGEERKLDLGSRFQCHAQDNVRSIVKTRKLGFTLAEVLITLVIIGVVAALTIPVLNNNQSDKALKSALKKNATIFKQALDLYYAENGTPFIEKDRENMLNNSDKFLSYLKAENIGMDEGILKALVDGEYKHIDGSVLEITGNDLKYSRGCKLADGTDIWMEFLTSGTFGELYVYPDLNGINKGPNQLGKDIFVLPFRDNNKLFISDEDDPEDLHAITYRMLYK